MNKIIHFFTINEAKRDIYDIATKQLSFKNIALFPNTKGTIGIFFAKLITMILLPLKVDSCDTILIQYPYKKFYNYICRVAKFRGAKTITVIHDLRAFRRKRLTPKEEIKALSLSDSLISHNPSMTKWLRDHGFTKPIIDLNIFDYLSDSEPNINYNGDIVVVANYNLRRSRYILEFNNILINKNIIAYGASHDIDFSQFSNIIYKGKVQRDKLIATISGSWGLVWDGDSINECTGAWGEYLAINNPHKISFYLRCGIPVILWSKSAMADFIVKNKLGIAIDTLADLEQKIDSIDANEYAELCKNAVSIKQKLNDGYFIKQALQKTNLLR